MRRYGPAATINYSFGPGPITPAVKAIILANIAFFVVSIFYAPISDYLGLVPEAVLERFWVWQLATYMFLHASPMHILFNMLGVWMFGVELERMWGTAFFARFYAITGIGAGITVVAASLLPVEALQQTYAASTIGASGALYGLLMAFALYFPTRTFLVFFVFPVQARYFVMILGAMALLFSLGGGAGVAHTAHLGGLLSGYLYLKGKRLNVISEIQYRYLKWRINRMRKKFDVYSGGRRDDYDRRVH